MACLRLRLPEISLSGVRAPTPGAALTRAKSTAEARDRGRPRPRGRRGPSATTTTDRQGWQPRASTYARTPVPPARRRRGAARRPTGTGRQQANRRQQGHRHNSKSTAGDAPDLPHSRPQRRQHNTRHKDRTRRGQTRQDGYERKGGARVLMRWHAARKRRKNGQAGTCASASWQQREATRWRRRCARRR